VLVLQVEIKAGAQVQRQKLKGHFFFFLEKEEGGLDRSQCTGLHPFILQGIWGFLE
jgi:hypothetical protein